MSQGRVKGQGPSQLKRGAGRGRMRRCWRGVGIHLFQCVVTPKRPPRPVMVGVVLFLTFVQSADILTDELPHARATDKAQSIEHVSLVIHKEHL